MADQRLIVALPALDEAATIGDVIQRIPENIRGITSVQILVIDDGSQDLTGQIATDSGAIVIRHASRQGVGSAFQTAVRFAIQEKVDFLATLDSDGQFDPSDLHILLAPVVSGEADFATASRFKDKDLTPTMPAVKRWGNRQMSRLVSSLTRQKFFDVSCGMRCYNRKALLNLNLMGDFTYTQEVFLNLAFKKMKIAEIPIEVRGEREFGKSRVAGSVVRYGLNSSRIMGRSYRDYRPLKFFGGVAICLAIPAIILAIFLAWHYLSTGRFSPHKWAGFTAGALGVFSMLMFYAGMLGDMLVRHRIYLEELLYLARDQHGMEGSNSNRVDQGEQQQDPGIQE